jgi:uncharacterized protein YndB with AHSA1/START domain
MTATLETINDRPALRFEQRLAHPVERVWEAVTAPAELERWFPAAADWTPKAGEVFEAGGQRGEVTTVDPPRLLAWTFGPDRYRFELLPDGDGCTLVFTYEFDDRAFAAQFAAGWETYLNRLEPHLDGGFLSEEGRPPGIRGAKRPVRGAVRRRPRDRPSVLARADRIRILTVRLTGRRWNSLGALMNEVESDQALLGADSACST